MIKICCIWDILSHAHSLRPAFITSHFLTVCIPSVKFCTQLVSRSFEMTTVIKSPRDPKLYRVIKLDNGLTALLISDTSSAETVEHQSVSAAQHDKTDGHGTEIPAAEVDSSNSSHPRSGSDINHTSLATNDALLDQTVTTSSPSKVFPVTNSDDKTTTDAGHDTDTVVASDNSDSSWTDMESTESDSSSSESEHVSSSDDGGRRSRARRDSKREVSHARSRSRVHQPQAKDCQGEKLAAAALCIGVGSFSDPTDIPGLAHFLEHMVFMGSQKYPNENDFDNYVTEHGGSSNAYTDCEQTVFHFDVQREHFHSALDRFGQFFIKPLMKKDSVNREIEAIDSEFKLSLPSDKYRLEQLLSSLANKAHPMSKFMWGNVETLKRNLVSRKIDIYRRLQNFRLRHYLAQYMTLAVESQDSLDQLESWVREIFSPVPSSSQPKLNFQNLPLPFSNTSFTRLYKVVPVKTVCQVILTWALPSQLHNYRIKPLHYIGWLVGHEGAGSLASYLRHRHWAVNIESGNSDTGIEHNSTVATFSVAITLSDDGCQHVFEVITAVFEYLTMLRQAGPQQRIFNEIKTIEECEFRFQEPDDPQDHVESLCLNMQEYEPEHYIVGSELMLEYNESVIRDCTDALTADKVNVVILSNNFAQPGFCNRKEKWYKTPYRVEDIPNEWLQKWLAPDINTALFLPNENPYIATDFDLKTSGVPATEYPTVIRQTAVSRLWYKKDSRFKIPRAYINFNLITPVANSSPCNMCMTELLVKLLTHSLSECVYDAELAELSYEIKVQPSGIALKFGGFNDKLLLLFRTVIDFIANLSICDKDFEVVKHDWATVYTNLALKPEKLNRDIRLSVLEKNHWTIMEKQSELENVCRSKLVAFIPELLSSVHVEGLAQGNITPEEAIALEDYLLSELRLHTVPPSATSRMSVSMLPARSDVILKIKNRNPDDDNCVITNYYQHGPANIHQYVLMDLLLTYMEEPCFDYLRTRKQLGYNVECCLRDTHGILGYSLTICSHSAKYSMKYLDEQVEAFLVEFDKRVQKLSQRKFNKLVKSSITSKCIEDTSLADEVERNWIEVVDETDLFDRHKYEIQQLESLTLDEFQKWSTSHLLPSPDRRKLSVQVLGNKRLKPSRKNCISSKSASKKSSANRRLSDTLVATSKNKLRRSEDQASAGIVSRQRSRELIFQNGVHSPDKPLEHSQSVADNELSAVSIDSSVKNAAVDDGNSVKAVIYLDDVRSFQKNCVLYPPSKILL